MKVSEDPPTLPEWGSYWRHRNGNIYKVIMITNLGSENDNYQPQIIYTNIKNGSLWSRPASDWARSFTPAEEK